MPLRLGLRLKWTKNNNKYYSKIEESKDIQLAIYSGLVAKGTKTAYFMFDSANFYTRYDFHGNNVIKVAVPDGKTESDVLDLVCNSYRFRMEELKHGKIELGDNFSVSELDYFNACETMELIELDMDKKNKIKYSDKYSGMEFFKGLIKLPKSGVNYWPYLAIIITWRWLLFSQQAFLNY